MFNKHLHNFIVVALIHRLRLCRRAIRESMEIHRNLWLSIEIYRNQWISFEINAIVLMSIEIYGCLRSWELESMETHKIYWFHWKAMQIIEKQCKTNWSHWKSWLCIKTRKQQCVVLIDRVTSWIVGELIIDFINSWIS